MEQDRPTSHAETGEMTQGGSDEEGNNEVSLGLALGPTRRGQDSPSRGLSRNS